MTLYVVESLRLLDTDASEDHSAAYVAMCEERGQPGCSLLVDENGTSLTPTSYTDDSVAFSARGLVARRRRLTQEALGSPLGADYVAVHAPWLFTDQVEPWTRLSLSLRAQPCVGRGPVGDDAVARTVTFEAGPIDIDPTGTHFAVVEFRGDRANADATSYQLVVEDVATGRRTAVLALGVDRPWENCRPTFSADGTWLLLSPEFSDGPATLVNWAENQAVTLPPWLASVAWNPHAGPSSLIGVRVDGDERTLGTFDVQHDSWEPLGWPAELHDVPRLVGLTMRGDGTQLAACAPVGLTQERIDRWGSADRAVVLDVKDLDLDLLLPPTFANGLERSHRAVMWADGLEPGEAPVLSAGLERRLRPLGEVRPFTQAQLASHTQRYILTLRDLALAAANDHVAVALVEDALRATALTAITVDDAVVHGGLVILREIVRQRRARSAGDTQRWVDLVEYFETVLDGDATLSPFPISPPARLPS